MVARQWFRCVQALLVVSLSLIAIDSARSQAAKPNILVIFGDDIGTANVSAYSDGVMGYETPHIDRIANEGLRFLHYYGEQSCTAGRSAFLTGQHIIRTGLSKVGFPGAPMGMSQKDPSIGGLMRNLGYATGQFGKNHVGDRNETLPTVNGFDEFFGNLYHLNAEEEPELPDYPKEPAFKAQWGPRGVLDCKATDVDDPTEDPRFGRVGKQTIKDTGALTKKRMETIDDETSARAIDFIKRQHAAGKPFFCWFNSTRMHLRTHVRPEHRGRYQHGDSEYIDGMIEHDETVGSLLKALDELGIADDTIVVYTTDNGPHMNTWPDGAMTPYRSEKNTNWEGAFRVPCLVRWPGHIKAGTITNELMSHNDWIPTLCAIAGEPDIVAKLKQGYATTGLQGREYKVHLDGYDQSKFLTTVEGTVGKNNGVKSARDRYFYSDDDGMLVALRIGDYKCSFAEQRMPGTMAVWGEPFTVLRMTKLYNLMQDPYERADITSNTYWDWIMNHVPQVYEGMGAVMPFVESFKEFPPRSVPQSFNPANMLEDTLREIKAKKKIEQAYPMLAPEVVEKKQNDSGRATRREHLTTTEPIEGGGLMGARAFCATALLWLCFSGLAVCRYAWSAEAVDRGADATRIRQGLSDRMLHRRAVEAVIWGMPAVNYERMLEAAKAAGAKPNQMVYWSRPVNWKNQTLTPNPDTIYFNPFYDTTAGPVVVEIPPADADHVIVGSFDVAWQNALADVGPAGADKGQGAKYLITPPGYQEKAPVGYIVLPSETYRGFVVLRSNFKSRNDADIKSAVEHGKRVKVYPLGGDPDSTVFVDAYDKPFDATIPYDETFFELLNRFVQAERWLTRDKAMIDTLKTVGIEKGKPFKPDDATKRILADAVREAHEVIALKYENGFSPPFYEGTHWGLPIPPETRDGLGNMFADPNEYGLDGRGVMYHMAYFSPKVLGAGQFYLLNISDGAGKPLDGRKTYRLTVPPDAPIEQYWSATAYDRETHALIRGVARPSLASNDTAVEKNADGSTDIYFGPTAPPGKESNWVPTDPKRHFELLFRLYGPKKELFEKQWKLPDIEELN